MALRRILESIKEDAGYEFTTWTRPEGLRREWAEWAESFNDVQLEYAKHLLALERWNSQEYCRTGKVPAQERPTNKYWAAHNANMGNGIS